MQGNQLLGYLILDEPKEFTELFECAAWYKRILVQPGRYPVYAHSLGYRDPYYAVASLPGMVIGSNFSSYFGGVMVGKGKYDEDAGSPYLYHWQTYAYNFAEMVVSGNAELAEGFTIKPREYKGMNGEPKIMYHVQKTA